MESPKIEQQTPTSTEVQSLENEFTSVAAELKEAKARDSCGDDTTSSDGEHSSEWLKAKSQELQEKILAKLPEDKREAWIAKGQGILEQYGLVEESKDLKDSFIAKGMELLRSNKELTKTIKKLATNDDVQNQVKDTINNLKENELVKKSTDAFNIIKEDETTKELLEETKKVAGDLLKSEEAKEFTDISKTLFSDFAKSETVTSAITKAKTTWDENGDELSQKGKDITQKGIDSIVKGSNYLKEHEKDIKKTVKDHESDTKKVVSKSEEVIDNIVENRQKYAKMGIDALKKIQEDDTGRQLINKGLSYAKQIQAEGGIEAAIKKGTDSLKELKDNEEKRDELINKIKNSVLDFVLKYLPNVKVPTIKGETNDIKYKVSDIDLKGFKLNSDDVEIKFLLNRGKLDGARVRVSIQNLRIKMKNLVWKVRRSVFPKLNLKGLCTCETKDARLGLNFRLSVVDNNPQLTIEKPYLRLPNLDITIKESSIAGFANTLIKMFKGVIRHQIEKSVHDIIVNQANALLTPVNALAVQYWPTINQYVKANEEMSKVRETKDKDGNIVAVEEEMLDLDEVDVEFDEGSLGMELEVDETPKAISKTRVIGFTSNGFKKLQAEASGLIHVGDYITKVNGEDVINKSHSEIIDLIINSTRPFDITFARLYDSSSESESSSSEDKKNKKSKKHHKHESSSSESSSSEDEKKNKKSKKTSKKATKKVESSSDDSSSEDEKPAPKKTSKKTTKKVESSSDDSSSSSEDEKPAPKKASKKVTKKVESSSDDSSSSEDEKPAPKKATKKVESSSDDSSSSEDEKPAPKKAVKKATKKVESSSDSSSSEDEKPAPKKAAKKVESSSDSSSSEDEKPAPKKATKKVTKKVESSSDSSSSEDEKPAPKKAAKKTTKKVESSSDDSSSSSSSSSESEDDQPTKKGNTTYRKI